MALTCFFLCSRSDEDDVWKVFRGKRAIAALALGLSPRVARDRWLQASLLRHFPEIAEVLRVREKICFHGRERRRNDVMDPSTAEFRPKRTETIWRHVDRRMGSQ